MKSPPFHLTDDQAKQGSNDQVPQTGPQKAQDRGTNLSATLGSKDTGHRIPPPKVVYDSVDFEKWKHMPANIYTIKCYYGNPHWKIPWELKALKKAGRHSTHPSRPRPLDRWQQESLP